MDEINGNITKLKRLYKEESKCYDDIKHSLMDKFNCWVTFEHSKDEEITVIIHLKELSEDQARRHSEIAELYTIMPHDDEEIIVKVFEFKKF